MANPILHHLKPVGNLGWDHLLLGGDSGEPVEQRAQLGARLSGGNFPRLRGVRQKSLVGGDWNMTSIFPYIGNDFF